MDGVRPEIREPLGLWNDSVKEAEWSTLVTPLPDLAAYVRRDDGTYLVHRQISRSSRRQFVQAGSTEFVEAPPVGAVPASLGDNRNGQRQVFYRGRVAHSKPVEDPTTFEEFVRLHQPSHITSLLEHADLSEDAASSLADLLQTSDEDCHCGTDGGLLNGEGTFGFNWADATLGTILVEAMGRVPGRSTVMSSTRAELCGILGALTYLRLVIEYYVLEPYMSEDLRFVLFCDSKGAIRRVENLATAGFTTTRRCRNHYDLEAAIALCLERLPVSVDLHWVKGHAERRKKPDEYSWAERLNVSADEMATAARHINSPPDSSHWPEQVVSVSGPRGRLLGRLSTEIRHHCTADDLRSYYWEKYKWTPEQYKTVDESGTRKAMSRLTGGQLRRVQKLRCGWLPVNRREARIDPDRDDGCVACSPTGVHEETVDHLFQCPQRERRAAVMSKLDGLRTTLLEWNTDRDLINVLYSCAAAWVRGTDIPSLASLQVPTSRVGRLIAQAYEEQAALGWGSLFRGFLSASWRAAHDAFLVERAKLGYKLSNNDDGERWSGRLIRWFFDLFESVWKLRNKVQFGASPEDQLRIRTATADRTIRRLFTQSVALPHDEQYPFRESIATVLDKLVSDKERWIELTTKFLIKAFGRVKKRADNQQRSITEFYSAVADATND